jgi:phage-related protein
MKEIRKFPDQIQLDFLDLSDRLEQGYMLLFPLSRPVPDIGSGVHELRVKELSGQYRIIYFFKTKAGSIHFVHAFKKKSQATSKRNLDLARKRVKEVLNEAN